MGRSGECLGTQLGLGRSWGGVLRYFGDVLGRSWGALGVGCVALGGLLAGFVGDLKQQGCCKATTTNPNDMIYCDLGATLGACGGLFSVLGLLWVALWLSWVALGGSWGGLGSLVGALGSSWWVLVAQGQDSKAILPIPGGQGGGVCWAGF